MKVSLNRHCLDCGVLTRGKTRCGVCDARIRTGYVGAYVRTRRALISALRADGAGLCPLCDLVMDPYRQRLELDHVIAVVDGGHAGPVRLVHALCNARKGQVRGTTYTPGTRY